MTPIAAAVERELRLLEQWDELDRACQSVATALPSQMTEAAAKMDAARLAMRTLIQDFIRQPQGHPQ